MNEQVMNILSKKWVIPAAVGVTSFGGGAVLGYFLGKRNGDVFEVCTCVDDEKVEEVATIVDQLEIDWSFGPDQDSEIMTELREYGTDSMIPSHMRRQAEIYDEIPWELDEEAELMIEEDELEEAIAEQNHLNEITNDGDTTPEVYNVFAGNDSQWNMEDELAIRTADKPYVIHLEEWVADEAGYEQETVTYYAGDDIMANEADVPIYGFEQMMGELKFGHGSKDPSVVYIRNEALEHEWEVIRHNGRFEIEVLGHDIESAYEANELKHSVQRFRDE